MKDVNIGIVGAGQMGVEIAALFAAFEMPVSLVDVSVSVLAKAKEKISRLVSSNRIPQIAATYVKYTMSFEDLKACEFVLEAVSENLDIKIGVYEALSSILSPSAILATNTSAFSIQELAKHYANSSQFIGVHFMNPALKMPLVEIISADSTSESVEDYVVDLIQCVDKTPIKLKNSPGFIVNKLLIPMINEAFNLLHNNIATAEDIDKAMMLGASFPMGPLKLADFIGLDTCLAIMNTLNDASRGKGYVPSELLKQYVEHGKLGRKTKQGVYSY